LYLEDYTMIAARRAGTTTVTTLAVLAGAVAVSHWAAPSWTKAAGLDVWEMPALQSEIEADARQERVLTVELEETHRRMALKEALIDNLLNGKISMRDVLAGFLAANRGHEDSMMVIRAAYTGKSEEEKMAKNVLEFAAYRATGSFAKRLAILVKLTNEFKHLVDEPMPNAP
jgi:hypothetical protein